MSTGHLESELLQRAVGGDRASLSQVLLIHYDSLRTHVTRRLSGDLGRLVDADDVLHQTLVRAAGAIGRYEPRQEGAFRAWLKTIADNLIKDTQRKKQRERRAGASNIPRRDVVQESSWAALVERIAGDGSTPSAKTRRHENACRLRKAMAALPDGYREVIERYYLRDQSLARIAEAMGVTKGSIRSTCYRARKRLRKLMGQSSMYFSG